MGNHYKMDYVQGWKLRHSRFGDKLRNIVFQKSFISTKWIRFVNKNKESGYVLNIHFLFLFQSTASVEDSLASISSKLKCIPLLLQLPYYEKRAGPTSAMGSGLRGILDVVEMRRLIFDQDSKGVKIIPGLLMKNMHHEIKPPA